MAQAPFKSGFAHSKRSELNLVARIPLDITHMVSGMLELCPLKGTS